MTVAEKPEERADLWIRTSDFFTSLLLKLFKEAEIPVNVHSSWCDVPTPEYLGRFTQGYGAVESFTQS